MFASPLVGRRTALALGLALASTTFGAPVFAQDAYPTKPIRLVVPFPPGGGTDHTARAVAQKLTENVNWTIVVENRPGAGGNLGVDLAAKSAPDGYTLVLGQTSNLAINPTLYPKLPYKPLTDLTPVVLVSSSPIVLAVGMKSPYKTFADVVAASKKTPRSVTMGFAGNGTVAHLASVQAQKAAGIELQHVPYKGAAQAMTDLMSGQIDVYMGTVATMMGHFRTDKLRPLAVTSLKRAAVLPNTPTLAESGYKDFDASTWFGILAPAGTPEAIIKTVNAEVNKVLSDPAVAEKLRSDGGDVLGGTPTQFAEVLKNDIPRWGQVVKDSGAVIE